MLITRLLLVASTLTLSACATPPQWLANHYNRQDPCQNYHNRADYQMPNWCGASSGRTLIYNNQGQRQGYIR
jgi:starvation-inducible outer membrane lipoprotein